MRTKHNHHKKRRTPLGAPPGTMVADPEAAQPNISVIKYSAENLSESKNIPIADLKNFVQELSNVSTEVVQATVAQTNVMSPVTWVRVVGLGNIEILEAIRKLFDIHELAMEDVINAHQRTKVDQYPGQLFIVAQMLAMHDFLLTRQLSMFLGKNYLLTFEECEEGCFDPVLDRLRKGVGSIRSTGADYLTYSLLDSVVDHYFPILEDYGERLDSIQEEAIIKASKDTLKKMHEIKRSLLSMRRAIWPMREAVTVLFRDPNPLISGETRVFMRDLYDHVVRVMDFIETYRELGSDSMDLYLSSISNRLNEVMKVLTVFSTLFIPPTFIASIYGMNFNRDISPFNLPETNWYYGYPICLAVMFTVMISMLLFLKRRGWLG